MMFRLSYNILILDFIRNQERCYTPRVNKVYNTSNFWLNTTLLVLKELYNNILFFSQHCKCTKMIFERVCLKEYVSLDWSPMICRSPSPELLPQIHVFQDSTLNTSPISLCFGHVLVAVRSALCASVAWLGQPFHPLKPNSPPRQPAISNRQPPPIAFPSANNSRRKPKRSDHTKDNARKQRRHRGKNGNWQWAWRSTRNWIQRPNCFLVSTPFTSETTSRRLINWIGAATSISDIPNSNVALFDLAFPGSQPVSVIVYNAVESRQGWSETGIPNRDSLTSSPRCHCTELWDTASESVWSETLLLPGSAGGVSNHTILW